MLEEIGRWSGQDVRISSWKIPWKKVAEIVRHQTEEIRKSLCGLDDIVPGSFRSFNVTIKRKFKKKLLKRKNPYKKIISYIIPYHSFVNHPYLANVHLFQGEERGRLLSVSILYTSHCAHCWAWSVDFGYYPSKLPVIFTLMPWVCHTEYIIKPSSPSVMSLWKRLVKH